MNRTPTEHKSSDESFARLQRANRMKALRRRLALALGVVSLLLLLYLGLAHGMWGTGYILAPLGIGSLIIWAIEEIIVRAAQLEG